MTVVVADKDAYIEKLLADIGNRAVEKTRLVSELARQTEARKRAEAQRDRLASALREIAQGAHWTYQNEHTLRPSQLRDIALTALREIEGGSDV